MFLSFMILCSFIDIHGSAVTILGEQNKNIILPCSFKPDKNELIHWTTRDEKNVHSYYDRTDQLQTQNKDYSGRTSLFLNEISKGNASLQIRDLKKSDENTYMCYVGTEAGNTEYDITLQVIGSAVTILGEQNKNIILPCSFKPDRNELIHWTTRDGKNVHSYYDRTDQLQTQNKDYSGRTSLFLHEISKGNASLQIRDLKKSDENTYMCYVGTEAGNTEYDITLQVIGSTVTILGEQNKNIILPCSFKPDKNELIHWTTKDEKNVHSYYDRTDQLQTQNKDYSGRTSLFLHEISKGNASLQIRDLKKSDENTYMCYVGTEAGNTDYDITLQVVGFQHLMEYKWDDRGLLTLTCSVNTSSSEDIIIKWYENGQNVKNDHSTKSSYTTLNNSLKYQCTVDHSIVQSRWTGTWAMKERTIKKDDNISCGCSICQHDFYFEWNFRHGNNEVTIASMHNSSPTISADYKNRVDNFQEHHLNLAKLSANDNGIYTCLIVTRQTTDIEMTSVSISAGEIHRDRTPLCAPFITVLIISCITFKSVRIKEKQDNGARAGQEDCMDNENLQSEETNI